MASINVSIRDPWRRFPQQAYMQTYPESVAKASQVD